MTPADYGRTLHDDQARLAAIADAAQDPAQLVELIHAYYGERARADRAAGSGIVFLHLGMLSGAVLRLLQLEAGK